MYHYKASHITPWAIIWKHFADAFNDKIKIWWQSNKDIQLYLDNATFPGAYVAKDVNLKLAKCHEISMAD